MQIMEVLSAIEQMVLNLDVKTSTKIFFNSICHMSFPLELAYVTVVALGKGQENDEALSGAAKALASGEVYFHEGKYFTLAEEDINVAVA